MLIKKMKRGQKKCQWGRLEALAPAFVTKVIYKKVIYNSLERIEGNDK
jgi:hypothetical protein